jgi:alpha-tubulin suppressor-like RCC1 family protein
METPMPNSYVVTSISCGRDHTLALLASGKVFGWGRDGSGRIAPDTPEYCSTSKAPTQAVEVNARQRLVSVAAGYGVSLAITAGDQVAVWGANSAGIGGRPGSIALSTPHYLTDIAGARAVVAGEFLFGAIDAAGTIHTWGLNDEGALGRPTSQLNALPGPVTTSPPASQLALGNPAARIRDPP